MFYLLRPLDFERLTGSQQLIATLDKSELCLCADQSVWDTGGAAQIP